MAQGTYTVNTVPVRGREYTNKHGTALIVWRLGLDGAESAAPDGLFELHKKKAPPQRGEEIEVERSQEGEFNGEKFTRLFLVDTYNKPDGGGSSGGGQDSKNFDRRPEHPRNEARMIHTSALSATPAYIEQMLTIGVADQPKSWDEYWKLVGKVATKLTRSYEAAMEPQQQLPMQQQEVPAETDGLEPKVPVPDESIPF